MKYKFGILGLGKMGSSILFGIIKSNLYSKEEILLYDVNDDVKNNLISQGFKFSCNEQELVENVNTLLIAIKPQMFYKLNELNFDGLNLTVVSIAAGKTINNLQEIFGNQKFIRVMPNTPALISCGATAIARGVNVDQETFDNVKRIFVSIGVVEEIEESKMNEVIPINGSMPAYLYYFVQAFIEQGVKDGIEYDITKPIKEDITLTANWIETPELSKKYTVTFDFGEEVKTQTVKENELVIKPVDPIKEKHKFLGWYIEDKLYNFETPVTKNITITAKYEKTRVTINFDLNGGSGTTITEIDKGSRLKKPDDPEKFGYHFVEWTLNGKKYNFNTIVKEDITLKATYEAIEYVKVKFDTDGGTIIAPKLLEKGQKLSNVGIPLKEGYIFNYWLLEDKKFDLNTKIEKSITLKAIYEPNNLQEEPTEEE